MKEEKEANRILELMFIGSPFDYPDKEDFNKAKRNAIQCALIHVNGIIEELKDFADTYSRKDFWQRVKTIIENK